MTKVLHLLEWFERGGGIEQIVGEIALGLDRDRYTVEIWCIARGGNLVEEYRAKGISVRVLNIHTYHNPFNIFKLARLFKEAAPDIIHAHVYFAATIGRLAAKRAGVPVVINHVHSTYWHYSAVNVMIERYLSKSTDKIICVADVVRDFVVNYEKIDVEKTVVISNGVSKQNVELDMLELRRSINVGDREILIISVASLLANKGHVILIDAVARLKEKHKSVKCWIVGEGPEETALKKQVARCELKADVLFLGVKNNVPELLAASDIFVLPSLEREGLPVSVIEAMAYGLPVVASCVGGIPEIITDGENGCLLKPGDAGALSECLARLIEDTERRNRLGRAAEETFHGKYDARIMNKAIAEVYAACLKGKGNV